MNEEEKIHALTILEKFDFPIEEYATDNGLSVIEEAIALYSSKTNNSAICPDMQNFIARQIERKYNLKISNNTSLMVDPHNGNIRCFVDGQSINGKVKYTPKEITVYLTHEGVSKSQKSIILPFSSMRYTDEPFLGSDINEKGLQCAKELFLRLYYQQRYSRS